MKMKTLRPSLRDGKLIIALGFMLILCCGAYSESIVYEMSVEVSRNDTATLKGLTAEYMQPSNFPETDTKYYVEVLSYDNKVLLRENLEISFTMRVDPVPGSSLPSGTVVPTKDTGFYVFRIPYDSSAAKIIVYHKDKQILSIDLNKELCNGNGKCEIGENAYNCPLDCPAGPKTIKYRYWDDLGNESMTTVTANGNGHVSTTAPAANNAGSFPSFFYMIVIVLVLLFVLFIGLGKMRNRGKG